MASVPFAFSVHHFINSVGADAGFASIIGLAILILLYFAQARETSNLRNHAQEAAQRIQDLETRLAQATRAPTQSAAQRSPVQAQPGQAQPAQGQAATARPAAAVAAPAGARLATAGIPVAPAGVAAPALTAATKLIPTPAAAPVSLAPSGPPDATIMGGAPAVAPGSIVPPAAQHAPTMDPAPAPATAAPATVAGGANGAAQDQVTSPPRPASAAAQAPRPVQLRPPAAAAPPRRPPTRPAPTPPRRSFGGGRVLLALVGVLVLGGVIAGLLVLTSSNGSSPSSSSQARTTNALGTTKRAGGSAVTPSSVTVAVLNGTATSGLAHRVALKLSGDGYKQGTVATATDQTKTTTAVSYLPGFRRDALAVAGTLQLRSNAVTPVDQPTQAVACPPPGACTADVVVTVGADLASTQ